jgi:transposase
MLNINHLVLYDNGNKLNLSFRGDAMSIRITLENKTFDKLQALLGRAKFAGDIRTVKRVMVILSLAEGHSVDVIAAVLRISVESVRLWFIAFMHEGVEGLRALKPSGRPSKLTKTQKTELDEIVTKGPVDAGYPGACWRSPMIQDLIYQHYGILYSVNYVCQLLKNMGFSFQKAKFVADHKDHDKREEWLKTTWNEILLQAKQRKALILFGDEASFPQWGTLTYTWAKRGQQPTVKTSGIRKGYKVFGLIEYFSGKFFFKGQEERLNSDTYTQFLSEVLNQTDKHLILIQDGARYHTSKAMQEFFAQHSERLTVYKLPSYSPDYNPIEKLWKKIKQDGTHLHYFPTFEALVGKVNQILPLFKNSCEKVLSLFGLYNELDTEMNLKSA